MLAVTESFRAVDAAAVAFVRRCYWVGNNPTLAADRAARRLPGWLVDGSPFTNGGSRASSDRRPDGGAPTAGREHDDSRGDERADGYGESGDERAPSRLYLRASIGTTILLIVLVLTVLLALLLV
jgi:multicomponent Na+:H+ antiporter subunit D